MSATEDAKQKLDEIVAIAKKRVNDLKNKRKTDGLLTALGRAVYRQQTDRGGDDTASEISGLVIELQALEAAGADVAKTGETPVANDEGAPDAAEADTSVSPT